MKPRIKTLTPWLLLAPLLLFLSYGPANSAISTGTGGAAITGAASTIATADLTASRVLVSNSSGKVAVSTVTSTTLGYLDIGGSLTTLLAGKAASSHTHDVSDISGILGSATGGTGNGFTKFTGPTTSEKIFTLPNASATILTDNALVTSAQGGTGNGFTKFTGPTTSEKTFTLPNASATILTDNAVVTVAQGGTGSTSLTAHYVPVGNGTSAVTMVSPSTAGYVLTSNGTGSDPSFQAASGNVDPGQTQFRLSVSTGVPVVTSTVTNATSIFAVPYKGNRISLYSGSAWLSYSTAEMSLSLTGFTASKNYDIFCYANGSTPTLEGLVWTNDTTRATALTTQDGVLVKTGATTRKYLGTIRIDSTGGQVDYQFGSVAANGGAGDFGVWNYYNRVLVSSFSGDSTDSWTYATNTWRAGNNSSTFRHSFVVGWQEDAVKTTNTQVGTMSSPAVTSWSGIGVDSTTSPSGIFVVSNNTDAVPAIANYSASIIPGYHYVAGLEKATGATATFYGDNGAGNAFQTGLQFEFWM